MRRTSSPQVKRTGARVTLGLFLGSRVTNGRLVCVLRGRAHRRPEERPLHPSPRVQRPDLRTAPPTRGSEQNFCTLNRKFIFLFGGGVSQADDITQCVTKKPSLRSAIRSHDQGNSVVQEPEGYHPLLVLSTSWLVRRLVGEKKPFYMMLMNVSAPCC